MPQSRALRNRTKKFDKNVNKRGVNDVTEEKTEEGPRISTPVIAFFVFLLVGSGIVQILMTIGNGPMFK